MPYEGKTPLILLFLVVSFFYVAYPAVATNQESGSPSAFGKIISRLMFDNEAEAKEVVFVGDVMLARDVERRLASAGQEYPFAYVREMFADQFVFGNFEAAVPKVHQETPDFSMRFSVKSDNLDSLVSAKFTHWSLANNHAFDFGEAGYQETLEQLNLRGFAAFGHPDEVSSSSLTEILVNEQKVGVIALNAVTRDPDPELLRKLVDSANIRNDFLIVYIHWGEEYQNTHNSRQEQLAKKLIDQGVDLIIGQHPHVVQDIDSYNGRLIIYSLGNFLFDQYFSDEVQQGLAVKLTPKEGKAAISLIPVSSLDSKIQPQPMTGEAKAVFLEALAKQSPDDLKNEIMKGEIELTF